MRSDRKWVAVMSRWVGDDACRAGAGLWLRGRPGAWLSWCGAQPFGLLAVDGGGVLDDLDGLGDLVGGEGGQVVVPAVPDPGVDGTDEFHQGGRVRADQDPAAVDLVAGAVGQPGS